MQILTLLLPNVAEVKIHRNLQLQGSYPLLTEMSRTFLCLFLSFSVLPQYEKFYPEGLSVFAHACTWSGLDKVSTKIQGLSRSVRTLQLSFCKVLKNKYCLVKVLPERLSSKGNIVGFCAQTQDRTALQNSITQTGKETLIVRVDEIIWRDHEMKTVACNFIMFLIISQCLTKPNHCR